MFKTCAQPHDYEALPAGPLPVNAQPEQLLVLSSMRFRKLCQRRGTDGKIKLQEEKLVKEP